MNDRITARKHKFKKYKRLKIIREYALLFNNSNAMLDYVCNMHTNGIVESKLYTKGGKYQLIINCEQPPQDLTCTVFKDKFHIDEIKQKNRLVCSENAIKKIQKAFKAT